MSQRRIFAIGVLLTLAAVVLAAGTVAWNGAIDFGRYLDEGLLGPEGQRQRIALAEHGFTVSIGADWITEIPAPDPQRDERLGMHALLSIDPGEDGAACTVYVAARAAPHQIDADEEPGDNEVLTATAVRLLGPWLEEQGLNGDALGTTTGDDWGGKAGFSFDGGAATTAAAWVVPDRGDLYVLACTWTAGNQGRERPEFWGDPHLMMLALEPMADAIEHLPRPGPAPTPRVLGQGGHVWATEPGVGLTFPRGWAVVESGAEDHGQALNFVDPRRMVPELHTAVLGGARLPEGQRREPLEWCAVDLEVFPFPPLDILLRWKEDAALEDVMELMMPTLLHDSDQPEATYLELPAGRAVRFDQPDQSAYLLRDRNTFFRISCAGEEPPGDRWLSIAETFEFLPRTG